MSTVGCICDRSAKSTMLPKSRLVVEIMPDISTLNRIYHVMILTKSKTARRSTVQTWEAALDARDDLSAYGDNAIGLFALALRFNIEDLDSVAADAITDGSDDKKCDILYVDREERSAVIAQCYVSRSAKSSAPANKASDLNTAVAWLLQTFAVTSDHPACARRPARLALRRYTLGTPTHCLRYS